MTSQARPRKGAEPKLTPEELASLPELLAQRVTEYGFLEEIRTCERVAQSYFGNSASDSTTVALHAC